MALGDRTGINEVEVRGLEANSTRGQYDLDENDVDDTSGRWVHGSFEFRKEALDRRLSRSQITGKLLAEIEL